MVGATEDALRDLGRRLEAFCATYAVPIEYFFDIINDQKVLPMLRGKGMEYGAYLVLGETLNPSAWSVQKLNVSAQPGTPDQDIGVTHRRTAVSLIVESKSAVRGSMRSGERSRIHRAPHFTVKCHRSRSNISLAGTSNDRYPADSFDVLITNPSNALYIGGTIGEELELISDPGLLEILYHHYHVTTQETLLEAMLSDWRFVLPADIAVDGFIPRTPAVLLADDPHWLPLDRLDHTLLELVQQRYQPRGRLGRS